MKTAMGTTSSRVPPHDAKSASRGPRVRMTLPATAYTDAAWFANEMERVFARMWLAAGRTAELDRPGAFIRRDVAGASVLIVRGTDGDVRAFHNVCRHRGTRLCTEFEGTFQGRIQCPYHAWTYGLDGKLLAAPQMDEVEGFAKTEFPLHGVACDTWDGHIFINLSGSSTPLRAQLADLPARFAPWQMQDLRLGHRIIYDIATNWKLVVQNYNECLHCPIIHPLLNRMHHYLAAENVPTTDVYCGGAMGFKDGVETLSSDGKRRRAILPGLGDRERALVNYFAIYPNLLLTLHPDYMMTITIWPQECGRTKLIAEWHFHPDEMSKPGFVFEDAVDFWDRTNREDWAISEQSYLGISSRGYQPGPYSERERQLWEFDQFVLKHLAQPVSPKPHGGEGG
ncbi:MAG TPA: aromatic ring-hydroxylating dioxygenase subunit alpha [Vicinamibacterales bacterium]|nr:aromatic ring-hydroxylating dioxygenase subunit alpha [Vicinamibacterales bacterium]